MITTYFNNTPHNVKLKTNTKKVLFCSTGDFKEAEIDEHFTHIFYVGVSDKFIKLK